MLQRRCEMRKNLLTLGMECGEIGAELFLNVLDDLPNVKLSPQIGKATFTKKTSEHNLQINFEDNTAAENERISRAFHFPPFFHFYGKKVIPIDLKIVSGYKYFWEFIFLPGCASGNLLY